MQQSKRFANIFSMIFSTTFTRFFGHITYREATQAKEKLVDILFKNRNVVSIGVHEQQGLKGSYCVKVGLKKTTDEIPYEFAIKSDNGIKLVSIFKEVVGEIKAL